MVQHQVPVNGELANIGRQLSDSHGAPVQMTTWVVLVYFGDWLSFERLRPGFNAAVSDTTSQTQRLNPVPVRQATKRNHNT